MAQDALNDAKPLLEAILPRDQLHRAGASRSSCFTYSALLDVRRKTVLFLCSLLHAESARAGLGEGRSAARVRPRCFVSFSALATLCSPQCGPRSCAPDRAFAAGLPRRLSGLATGRRGRITNLYDLWVHRLLYKPIVPTPEPCATWRLPIRTFRTSSQTPDFDIAPVLIPVGVLSLLTLLGASDGDIARVIPCRSESVRYSRQSLVSQ